MTPGVQALHDEIMAMSHADRLRVAAALLDAGKTDVAHPIIERVALEIGAAEAISAIDMRRP